MKKIPTSGKADSCKPVIDYPCSWQYKIIGESRAEIRRVVRQYVKEEPLPLSDSNVSSSGRYVSMNLEITVHNDEQRLELYEQLAGHPSVKMVL